MKNYIIILIIFATKSFSQSSNDSAIFKSIFEGKKDSVVVISKQSEGYKKLEEIVSKKIICNSHFPEKSITLTNKEVLILINEIKKNNRFNFSEDTFPNALLISKDTIQSYSSNKSKKWIKDQHAVFETKDSIKILKFRQERRYQFNETYVHFFSKPIYFRNDTFCILYHADLCCFDSGMGGCMSAYIYRKNNNVWENYITITFGCY